MKRNLVCAFAAIACLTTFADTPRKVVLVVQNHAEAGAQIPMMALTDALAAKLTGSGLQVVNPYNAIGRNLNRTAEGEVMPEASANEVGRLLGAEGVMTASVMELLDSTIGNPPALHQYSIRLAINLADAQTGATICGATVRLKSRKYTNAQVAANAQEYLGELANAAAAECAAKIAADPAIQAWEPAAPLPPPPPPPPPINPNLTVSDIDDAVQRLFVQMRTSPVFISNYDKAQKTIGRAPLAIVGGLVDMTGGKAPCQSVSSLLIAGTQTLRMTLVNSALFDAKDDALVTDITHRIIANGNSPLEDGELMAALKQHGSPDFFVVGDMMYFSDGNAGQYRLRIALHNLHTGKIVWEGVQSIAKPINK